MITDDAERNFKRTEGLVGRAAELFAENKMENEKSLLSLGERLAILTEEMPELNVHVSEIETIESKKETNLIDQVCGKPGDPCDSLCGGAGCDICGGLSCEEGAVTKAVQSLDIAKDNDLIIKEKETKAEELYRSVS